MSDNKENTENLSTIEKVEPNKTMMDIPKLTVSEYEHPILSIDDVFRSHEVGTQDESFLSNKDIYKEHAKQRDFINLSGNKIKPNFTEKVGAGLHSTKETVGDIPRNMKNMYIRAFDGHIFPNMTEEQAQGVLRSSFQSSLARRKSREEMLDYEGMSGSNVVKASQIISNSLVYVFGAAATGGGLLALGLMSGSQAAGEKSQEYAEDYYETHGTLTGYDWQKDQAFAASHGAINGFIETKLGSERLFLGALGKMGVTKASKAALIGAAGEGSEELLQSWSEAFHNIASGHENRTWGEIATDSLSDAAWGAMIGGPMGGAAYYSGRASLIKTLKDNGLSSIDAKTAAQDMIDNAQSEIVDEMNIQNQLTEHFGEDYNALVSKIEVVMENTGFKEKYPDRDLNEYARINAEDIASKILRQSRIENVPVRDIMDISKIEAIDNVLYMDTPNFNNADALISDIASKKSEIKILGKEVGRNVTDRKSTLRNQIKLLQKRVDNLTSSDKTTNRRIESIKSNQDQQILNEQLVESTKAELDTLPETAPKEQFVYVGNRKLGVEYKVKELSEVVPSHKGGEINKDYKITALQNRNRSTIADTAVLLNRSNNLKPELLAESPNTQSGAPLINQENNVIAGNGRFETIRLAYENGKAEGYKDSLAKQGYDIGAMENPVLVRETSESLDEQQQIAVAEASNVSEISSFDKGQQALNDAKLFKEPMADIYDFGTKLPVEERQHYFLSNGAWNTRALQQRYDDAFLAWVMRDTKAFENLVLAGKLGKKKIDGVVKSAQGIVAFDNKYKEKGFRDNLKQALIDSSKVTRTNFKDFVAQTGIETNTNFTSNSLLHALTFSKNSGQVSSFIDTYLSKSSGNEEIANNSMFGDALPSQSEQDILSQTIVESDITDGMFKEDGSSENVDILALFTSKVTNKDVQFEQSDIPLKKDGNIKTSSPEFKNWFGDSKVVDKNGKPLVVYHGGNKGIKEFRTGRASESNEVIEQRIKYFREAKDKGINLPFQSMDKGAFFTPDKSFAENYTQEGSGELYEVYINMENPAIRENGAMIVKDKNKTVDGIIIKRKGEIEEIIVIDPTQIKSVDNRGTFDPQDPNIFNQGRKANGFYDAELQAIVIGDNFNAGTLPHEMAHFWLDTSFKRYKKGGGTPESRTDFQNLMSVLNIQEEQVALTRDQQENFASMTEGYIFNRAVLPQGTEPVIKTYLDWVPERYNSFNDIGFKDSNGKIQNPIFNENAKEYFDSLYAIQAGLKTSPTQTLFTNPDSKNGKEIPSTKEVETARLEHIEQDTREQSQDLDTFKEIIDSNVSEAKTRDISARELNILSEPSPVLSPEVKKQTFVKRLVAGKGGNTREGMFSFAKDYVEQHEDYAKEIAFSDPQEVENDTGIERGILIRQVMSLYEEASPEHHELYNNLAKTMSLAGKTTGLNNDLNVQFYLKGYGKINSALSHKKAIAKFGIKGDPIAKWNNYIAELSNTYAKAVAKTEPNTPERAEAVKNTMALLEEELGEVIELNQEDLKRINGIRKGQTKNFEAYYTRTIKKASNTDMTAEDMAELRRLSDNAQKASNDINSDNKDTATAAGNIIREWQDFVKRKEVPQNFANKVINNYLPRAMLSHPATHIKNIMSNTIENRVVKGASALFYGPSKVSNQSISAERQRLRQVYYASGLNLSQMHHLTSDSLIHGEKYMSKKNLSQGWGKVDPMSLLAMSDFEFRTNIYLDVLSRLATKHSKDTDQTAQEMFEQYKQIGTDIGSDAAKARSEALLVAEISVFTQNGQLARLFGDWRNSLNKYGRDTAKLDFGTLATPFVKTPSNIIEMGARAAISPATILFKIANPKSKVGIENMIDAGNFGVGALITMAILYMQGDYEPPYAGGKYNEDDHHDSFRVGDVWYNLDYLGPASTPIRMGLSMLFNGGIDAATALGNIPFLSNAGMTSNMLKYNPKQLAKNMVYNQLNKGVPSIAKHFIKTYNREVGNEAFKGEKGIKRKIARQYGLDGKDNDINDYIAFVVKGIEVD